MNKAAAVTEWPPRFTLDQERILNLLTGDRFYSNASAALREAVLNAIDAVHRRAHVEASLPSQIIIRFHRTDRLLTVADQGDGMSRETMSALFAKVGASAAQLEAGKGSVGEFGIGVVSYFMAGDWFTVQTNSGTHAPFGLKFSREMLAGAVAEELPPTQTSQGTTLTIQIRTVETYNLLKESFPHWCRGVAGLQAYEDDKPLEQGDSFKEGLELGIKFPTWIERAHLTPITGLGAWDTMSGSSTVSILYRGVFRSAVHDQAPLGHSWVS